MNYLAGEGPIPLTPEAQAGSSATPTLRSAIFQIGGNHATYNCHLLQKYMKMSEKLFYNFCRSVDHDEHSSRSYEMMMNQTPSYRVQTKMQVLDQNESMMCTGFHRHRRGRGGMGPRRGHGQLICYNYRGLGHYAYDCKNPKMESYLYCTQFVHEQRIAPH